MIDQIYNNQHSSELLNRALARLPACYQSRIRSIGQLPSESNFNYCLCYDDGKRAVLRIPGVDTALFGLNFDQEVILAKQLYQLGLSPQLLFHDPVEGLLLSEFYPSSIRSKPELSEPESIALLAKKVNCLHQSNVKVDRALDLEKTCDDYYKILKQRFASNDIAIDSKRDFGLLHQLDFYHTKISHHLQAMTQFRMPNTFCHHDLNPGNLLFGEGGGLMLIDWEYAGAGNPAYDIALLAGQCDWSLDQIESFLADYNDNNHQPCSLAMVKCAQPIAYYLQWQWYLLQSPNLPARMEVENKLQQLFQHSVDRSV